MRRSRKRIERIVRKVGRGTVDTARRSLPDFNPRITRLRPLPEYRRILNVVQDNRFFHPDAVRPLLNTHGLRSRVVVGRSIRRPTSSYRFDFPSPRVVFQAPKEALVCLRRARRKEVLHARGVAGSKVRKPRLNADSKIHCK